MAPRRAAARTEQGAAGAPRERGRDQRVEEHLRAARCRWEEPGGATRERLHKGANARWEEPGAGATRERLRKGANAK